MESSTPRHARIVHLSDLHFPLRDPVPLRALLGKRALGWANLRLRRAAVHSLEVAEALLESAAREEADLVLITGDFVNLALAGELRRASRILQGSGLDPGRTMLLPGNHDRYTPLADLAGAYERAMSDWLPLGFDRSGGYPLLRALGPVSVLGLDTATWRGPLRAAGRLDRMQLERLAEALASPSLERRHPVIAMHHPPFRLRGAAARDWRNGLEGRERLRAVLRGRSCTLLHGHLHRAARREEGRMEIVGAPSASSDTADSSTRAAYHLYTFDREGLCEAVAITLAADGSGFVRAPLVNRALDV
ncbi:MAG: metallophosphoesterase [Polyangia bacterium]